MTSNRSLSNPPPFICPYCRSPLIIDSKTWRCDGSLNDKNTQHPFDVARQGYVNLLPVQHKKSKDPGDSQESIEARHRFLSQEFYQPLQRLVAKLVTKADNNRDALESKTWLDIGSGEGYYTHAIAEALKTPSIQQINNLIALDISKPAVMYYAKAIKQNGTLWYQLEKQLQDAQYLKQQSAMLGSLHSPPASYPMVASASNLPIADTSIDGISSIFSPILPKEFARVLSATGQLIIAKPDIGHLQTLREALFDEVRPHDSDKFLDELAPLFELKQTHHVQADLSLDLESLTDLLTMTPYSYRAKAEKREALLGRSEKGNFQTMAKFVVYELVKVE